MRLAGRFRDDLMRQMPVVIGELGMSNLLRRELRLVTNQATKPAELPRNQVGKILLELVTWIQRLANNCVMN
jgi:hypothetical protein